MRKSILSIVALTLLSWIGLLFVDASANTWLTVIATTSALSTSAIFFLWRKDWNARLATQSKRFGEPELSSTSEWSEEVAQYKAEFNWLIPFFGCLGTGCIISGIYLGDMLGMALGVFILGTQGWMMSGRGAHLKALLNSNIGELARMDADQLTGKTE